MSGKIFISYRRDDSAGYARAIYDQLTSRFSRPRVFMDVDSIEPGMPFDQVIGEAVGQCDVLLAMIGRRWLEPQADGGLRLNDPTDFVRIEIAAALARNIRVIPVLLDGASMPEVALLPDPLRPLAKRNAIEVGNSRFASDIEKLVDAVAKVVGKPDSAVDSVLIPRSNRSRVYWLVGGAAAVATWPIVRWIRVPEGKETSKRESIQSDWRYCEKCQSLFFDGYEKKGICPAGGAHQAQGFNFLLTHDVPAPGQDQWRFCDKCQVLFFNGYEKTKGVCSAGGAHNAQGFNFVLLHDSPARGQAQWRFCEKCNALFFNGRPPKGTCPAGGAHSAAGYNFVLAHM